MKTSTSVIIILVALVIGTILLKNRMDSPAWNEDVLNDPSVDAVQLCFISNTDAGDVTLLSMDLREESVIGELYLLPRDEDSKIGIFKGTVTPVDPYIMSRTVNAIWETEGEGTVAQEELKIVFGEGTASPGFGEMKQGEDGVWRYADPAKIAYPLSLTDTDCGDDAMD